MPITYHTIYDAIIGTIASIITIYLISYFRSKVDNKKLANVIVIICITLFLLIANFVVKQKISNNSFFRKYLLGNDYIEGYWYDLSVTDSNKAVLGSIIDISFENNQYKVKGESFDTTGRFIAYFRSTSSAYNHEQDILFMGFDAKIKPGTAPAESGWEQFEFINSTTYHCSFFQTNRKKLNNVKGFKISGDTLKAYNNFVHEHDKAKFILNKIKAYYTDTQN